MILRRPWLLFFGLALALRCTGAEPTVLGVVYKDEPVSLELTFTNAGTSPVEVATITASCECLTVVAKPARVAPGATVKIPCRYLAAKTGRVAVDVVVEGATASTQPSPAKPLATCVVSGFVADKSWLLSPGEVSRRADEFSLVDTRASLHFAQAHIPRALNIHAFALKTRAELRTKKIVLVDDGFEPSALLAETAALRAQGFAQVFVLDGGMAAWIRGNLAVQGTDTAVKALAVAEISPADFYRARRDGVWQGVGVGPEMAPAVAGLFPAGFVQAAAAPDAGAALNTLAAKRAGGARILVIAADPAMPAQIEAHLPKPAGTTVYYLKGGLIALAAYQAEQTAFVANTGQTFQTKPTRRTPIVSGACGSCGK